MTKNQIIRIITKLLKTKENLNFLLKMNEKELKLTDVPRVRIEDYPGRVGNQILDAHIRALAN